MERASSIVITVPNLERILMFIAILDFTTAAEHRQVALHQLDREGAEVRAMSGNLAYRAFMAHADGTGVTLLHEWEDADSFARYLESESFARSGAAIRPLMTGAPVSRRFRAELAETVQ